MKLFCQQENELEISVIHTDTHFYKFQLNIVSSVQTVIVFIIIHVCCCFLDKIKDPNIGTRQLYCKEYQTLTIASNKRRILFWVISFSLTWLTFSYQFLLCLRNWKSPNLLNNALSTDVLKKVKSCLTQAVGTWEKWINEIFSMKYYVEQNYDTMLSQCF